jgi:hypothetical protein
MSEGTTSPDTITRLLRRRAEVGTLWIDTIGNSMGRAVPAGARVRVVAASRPRRGEVWAMCDDEGRIIVHRVLGEAGERWWLQGDANRSPDQPVSLDRLIGRVDEVEVAGRRRRLGPVHRVCARARLDVAAVWKRLVASARWVRHIGRG